ncbi:MAG: hypothetical protein QOH65_1088 [Methylobacteriaceae bacterium]|jgi:hypothetical protein|nr:hypothetical protein [Methylobacteriaceae bacterium]
MLIAQRILQWRGTHGRKIIRVQIFSPERTKAAWTCRYVIDWPDGEREKTASGVDAVQALIIAMQMIGSEIYTSNYQKTGGIGFLNADGCGFPVPPTLRHLLTQDDAKYL